MFNFQTMVQNIHYGITLNFSQTDHYIMCLGKLWNEKWQLKIHNRKAKRWYVTARMDKKDSTHKVLKSDTWKSSHTKNEDLNLNFLQYYC